MIYSGSFPIRSKLQLLGLAKMGEKAVSLSEGDTEVAYVTSAHMSVSELSHVAARKAERYMPQLVNHVPHSNLRDLLPKGRTGERIAGGICQLYHRTSPWTRSDSVYGTSLSVGFILFYSRTLSRRNGHQQICVNTASASRSISSPTCSLNFLALENCPRQQ